MRDEPTPDDPGPIDVGVAGASARAEHERRRANRQQRSQAKYGKFVAAALELREPPQHEQAWARGAAGEERLAQSLAKRCNASVTLLHDRAVPGSRANIDHLAVCPSGVWVIDPKRYGGKIAVHNPLFGQKKLTIASSDRTKLVAGVQRQVELVRSVLQEGHGEVSVQGALCFIDGDMPLLGLPDFDGVKLTRPRAVAKALNKPGPLGGVELAAIARLLSERLPAKL